MTETRNRCTLPRYSIGLGIAVRWPWRIGWDPLYLPGSDPLAVMFGRTYSWSLDLGLVNLTAHYIAHPKEWFKPPVEKKRLCPACGGDYDNDNAPCPYVDVPERGR